MTYLGTIRVLDDYVSAGAKVLHSDSQFNTRWTYANEMPIHHMKGNLSFMTNLPDIATLVEEWTWSAD